jgi:hypothetical protein
MHAPLYETFGFIEQSDAARACAAPLFVMLQKTGQDPCPSPSGDNAYNPTE